MKKIFTIAAALLASFSLMADDATFTMASIFDGNNQSAEVTDPAAATISTTASKSNAKDGKLGSDGNYFQIILSDATFSAVSMNGYINTTSTEKNWGFQFSTDGGDTWTEEVSQANDGDKTAHDIAVTADIPANANGFRVIRRAGTSTIVNSITLTLGGATPITTYTITYKANNGTEEEDIIDATATKVAACTFTASEGYKFAGWNTAADGTGSAYAVGTALTSDLTLYAQWAAVCYEAIYDLKAGIGSAEVTADNASIKDDGALVLSNSSGRITITPAEGSTFKKGDIIEFAGTVGNSSKAFGIKVGSDTYEAAEVIPNDPNDPTAGGTASYSGVLKADAETLVIGRDGGTTTSITSFVIKQETLCKTIVSTVETLTAVTINNVAISATDLATLVSKKYLFLEDAYVTAPVVKFTKHTVITYDDQTTKEKDEVIEVTSQPATTTWGASATINGNSYYVYTSKAASRTVTYMYGEQVLGTETVAANGNPAEYAQYETMPLATFGGWYKDADLTQAVDDIAAEVISADATYYAKFTKAFLSKNVNIEQLVLDYGTKYDIKAALTDAGWAYANLNDLDTLNDLENKAARNEPFLGLKMKTKGAYIQGNLKVDGILLVKFGNIGCDINVTCKGAESNVNVTFTKEQLWNEDDQAYVLAVFGFPDDVLVTITTTAASTVVLKQLMLDELAIVTLPAPSAYLVTCAEAENGKIEANWANKKYRTPIGETVTLTATPAEGYEIAGITVDGEPLEAVEGVYSFIMPAKDVTVAATFSVATALENVDASVKAVKVIQNGQLLIKKGNILYNAQGAVVQ